MVGLILIEIIKNDWNLPHGFLFALNSNTIQKYNYDYSDLYNTPIKSDRLTSKFTKLNNEYRSNGKDKPEFLSSPQTYSQNKKDNLVKT